MSPLVSAPVRGYADCQRVENYDSGLLFSQVGAVVGGGIFTSILDVSRFAYIGGSDTCITGAATVRFQFYSDSLGQNLVGTQAYQTSNTIGVLAPLRIFTEGPFVQVSWTDISGGAASVTSRLFGTNRAHPLQLIPTSPLLLSLQNVVLGAGTNIFYAPNCYYAGPAAVWFNNNGGLNTISIQTLNVSNNWDYVTQIDAASGNGHANVVIPMGAWRVGAAVGASNVPNFYMTVTPSLTGST